MLKGMRMVVLFRIFALFPILLCGGQANYRKKVCPEICGKEKEPSSDVFKSLQNPLHACKIEKTKRQREIDETRIVNGYTPGQRGWMVMIRIFPTHNMNDYETCGGSLINKRFVLTAAHCVCVSSDIKDLHIEEQSCANGELHPDVANQIVVYVGLNNKKIDFEMSEKKSTFRIKHEVGVEKVYKRKGWKGAPPENDIALLKLKKDVSFDGNLHILPLCLPKTMNDEETQKAIQDKTAYVAGWGLLKNEACFTNNFGPERHAKCRKFFKYKKRVHSGCVKIYSPSLQNKRCKQFLKATPTKYPKCPGEAIRILYNRLKKSVECYDSVDKMYGWCGTCNPDAQPGERGYCSMFEEDIEDIRKENTIVKSSRNWGFCSELCSPSDQFAHELQETKLTVLNDDDCKVFANEESGLEFIPGKEMCAAMKIPFPKMKVYERKKRRKKLNGQKYVFKQIENVTNTFNIKGRQAQMQYYLGHSDSCQGDSGGPLWQYIDGRATVIGVVSRGGDCAAFNSPGIYTNIQQHLNWINHKIKDFNC